MWNSEDLDNTGGGFLNSTQNNVDSPSQNKKGGARRLQSVVPVAIRQIRDSTDDEFKLFGTPTQILHIVGILRGYEVQSTKATYTIEDHTGEIKAIWWLESDEGDSTPKLPPVKEGSYVQLFGSLRNQDGEKIIMVLRMFLVDDANIVTSHLLQVIHTRLQAEYNSKNPGLSHTINNPGAALPNSMSFMDQNVADNGQNGFTPIQAKVQKLLETDHSTTGMNINTLLKSFKPNQENEVRRAIEFLVNEGHAYSTIDNDHFKSTSD